MASFKGQFMSVVLIGRHNPQILNHDFLVQNRVLPENAEPFRQLLAIPDDKRLAGIVPFADYVSTPMLSSIRYGPIVITIEESRFQIVDNAFFRDPTSTVTAEIVRRYFGELLKYTPLQIAGINFNGLLEFSSVEDEWSFDNRLGINRKTIEGWAGTEHAKVGAKISFRRDSEAVELSVGKPSEGSAGNPFLNVNFECRSKTISELLAHVNAIGERYQDLAAYLRNLQIEAIA